MDPVLIGGLVIAYGAAGGIVGGLVHARIRRRPNMTDESARARALFLGLVWPVGIGVRIAMGVSERAERKHQRRLGSGSEARQARIASLERELGLLPGDDAK